MNKRALTVGLLGLVTWLGSSQVCRAEYSELPLSKRYSTATLVGLGIPALILDGVSISHTRRGPGQETGRKVVFTLQLVEAVALPLAGFTWYYFAGTGESPRDTPIKLLTAAHLVLGLASLGLAIATTPGRPPLDSAHVAKQRRRPVTSWLVAPTVIAGESQQGLGLALAGLY